MFIFFFFKQKTAYEMRISDWSSDVCSSDLPRVDWPARRIEPATDRGDLAISDKQRQVLRQLSAHVRQRPGSHGRWQIFGQRRGYQIGSASGRERLGQYV